MLYEKALKEVEECILLCKRYSDYNRLAFSYVRKGIILKNLHQSGDEYIKKGIDIVQLLERDDLLNLIMDETKKYI